MDMDRLAHSADDPITLQAVQPPTQWGALDDASEPARGEDRSGGHFLILPGDLNDIDIETDQA